MSGESAREGLTEVVLRRSEKSSNNLEDEQQEVHLAPQHNVSTRAAASLRHIYKTL